VEGIKKITAPASIVLGSTSGELSQARAPAP